MIPIRFFRNSLLPVLTSSRCFPAGLPCLHGRTPPLHRRICKKYVHLCPGISDYLAEELLDHSFSNTMLNLNHGNMLWFFQPSKDFSKSIPNELTFLKSCLEDLMNYSMTTLHRNVNLILYPQPVPLDAAANTYYRLLQQLEIQNNGNTWTVSSVSVFEPRAASETSVTFKNSDRNTASQKLQELSFYLYQNTWSEYPSHCMHCGICVKSKKVCMHWRRSKSISGSLQH